MERSSSQLYVVGWDWMDGWDGWTVVIGRRHSKSTFGANIKIIIITAARESNSSE